MCLLINHPANTTFDFDDLADFYDHNSDGLGVMYAENGVLQVRKSLPASAVDAWEFYQKHCQGRECVIHLRMRTHGHTDLTNCHPYEVYGDKTDMPLYMAHNGILSTGNAKDVSKSDTWHYIRDFIIPLTKADPSVVFDGAFVDLIETHIGSSNKFIFMNHEGRVSIINERAFVEYKGAQLSNTYAWTSSRGGYGLRKAYGGYTTKNYGGYTSHADGAWWERELRLVDTYNPKDYVVDATVVDAYEQEDDECLFVEQFLDALEDLRYHTAYKALTWENVADFYAEDPDFALTTLEALEECAISESEVIKLVEFTQMRQVAQQS